MEVCYDCDIVHRNKKCPLCEANKKIGELENECEYLEKKVNDLENTLGKDDL